MAELKDLEYLGNNGDLPDLPITIGFSLPPAAFTKKAHVTLSLDYLPPLHCFAASERDLFGNAR